MIKINIQNANTANVMHIYYKIEHSMLNNLEKLKIYQDVKNWPILHKMMTSQDK